jgi:NAD(P)H-hydrate epimerase
MIGAPAFAGYAALRTGSGLVQIATPRSVLPHSLSICPELIGLGLGKSAAKDQLLDAGEKADAIAIGPGLGQTPEALARLQRLVRLQDKPMVLDADALNLLSKQKRWPTYFRAKAVLTPHPGEMKRLMNLLDTDRDTVPTDDAGRIELASLAARTFGCVVLLKGARTVITDGDRYRLNTTGDSTLSKAGTGDVLTGLVTSLLGQHLDPFDAASLGAHLHGLAGELAGRKLGQRCALAREVIDALPNAFAAYAPA